MRGLDQIVVGLIGASVAAIGFPYTINALEGGTSLIEDIVETPSKKYNFSCTPISEAKQSSFEDRLYHLHNGVTSDLKDGSLDDYDYESTVIELGTLVHNLESSCAESLFDPLDVWDRFEIAQAGFPLHPIHGETKEEMSILQQKFVYSTVLDPNGYESEQSNPVDSLMFGEYNCNAHTLVMTLLNPDLRSAQMIIPDLSGKFTGHVAPIQTHSDGDVALENGGSIVNYDADLTLLSREALLSSNLTDSSSWFSVDNSSSHRTNGSVLEGSIQAEAYTFSLESGGILASLANQHWMYDRKIVATANFEFVPDHVSTISDVINSTSAEINSLGIFRAGLDSRKLYVVAMKEINETGGLNLEEGCEVILDHPSRTFVQYECANLRRPKITFNNGVVDYSVLSDSLDPQDGFDFHSRYDLSLASSSDLNNLDEITFLSSDGSEFRESSGDLTFFKLNSSYVNMIDTAITTIEHLSGQKTSTTFQPYVGCYVSQTSGSSFDFSSLDSNKVRTISCNDDESVSSFVVNPLENSYGITLPHARYTVSLTGDVQTPMLIERSEVGSDLFSKPEQYAWSRSKNDPNRFGLQLHYLE